MSTDELKGTHKMYTVRIIPQEGTTKDTTAEDGGEVIKAKPLYIRRTKPDEKASAADFKSQRFIHLELLDKPAGMRLGGDTKPFPLIIFEGTDKALFEELEILQKTEGEFTVLPTESKVKVLTEKLPGLLQKKKAPKHYAMTMKNGVAKKLLANHRNDETGDFEKSPVILEELRYFLFHNDVCDEGDAIRYAKELAAIEKYLVKASPADVVAKAEANVVKTEAETEDAK